MHLLYQLVRFYPFWAIPLALVIFEVAWIFRRRWKRVQYYFFGYCILVLITVVCWIVFRGDLNSDRWVKNIVELNFF